MPGRRKCRVERPLTLSFKLAAYCGHLNDSFKLAAYGPPTALG